MALLNLDCFAGQADNPFDYQRRRLGHIQHDDLIVAGGMEIVAQFFHDQPFLRPKIGLHALSTHNRCLCQEEMNQRCQEDRRENDLYNFFERRNDGSSCGHAVRLGRRLPDSRTVGAGGREQPGRVESARILRRQDP